MSNLIKPYVISVWDDVWIEAESCFKEFRLGIIGADNMTYQGRALTPQLTRNVNGTKKLSFKMYKQFVDTVTGEKIVNPYVDLLINERKVKLEYDGKWFDFIVKDIVEKSSDHSVTYQLEDANVAELSKNGFSVTLDSELMNNSGTATELAEEVLKETDWSVSEKSDILSQTIEEALIYLKTSGDITNAIRIIDAEGSIEQQEAVVPDNSIVLGFYSSCVGKPHRFQFIYLPSYDKEDVFGNAPKSDRVIEQKNCQYYIQFDDEGAYQEVTDTLAMNLPECFSPYHPGAVFGEEKDSILSAWYRGRRYNFAQETTYLPLLERYVNVYLGEDGERYYGYADTIYASPTFTQNIVTNSKFASISGWTGTHDSQDKDTKKAIVDNVYGRFAGGVFISSTNDLADGTFDDNISNYKPYLKVNLTSDDACVINSGPRDNRLSIANMELDSEWYLKCVAHDGTCLTSFDLGEFVYSPTTQGYVSPTTENIIFGKKVEDDHIIFKVTSTNYTEATFKKNAQVRLKFCPYEIGEVYIESIELFRVVRDDNGNIIHPLDQASDLEALENRVAKAHYKYFNTSAIEGAAAIEDIQNVVVLPKLDNARFKPVYNEKAEKIRTVSAKESNYFNILQTIAETFEAWLDIEVSRDEFGGITAKEIIFKKYAGRDNLAGFRHGVNLKDVQRTYASKDIVTKLIVKDNSNQFAKNGFCTVARANANPIGETCLYDFQYYYNTNLLDPKIHLNVLYYMSGAKGKDLDANDTEWNIIGYYPRLGTLNTKIDKCNDQLIGLSADLTRLKAQREVAKTQYDAALSGCEEAANNFTYLSAGKDVTKWRPVKDEPRADLVRAQRTYVEYLRQKHEAEKELERLNGLTDNGAQDEYNKLSQEVKTLTKYKGILNRLFYKLYSRFIQEGTWLSEEYVDDELYYADAQSVLYNSCYPTVAYTIDVIAVDALPGYELYNFGLGDTTYVEDGEFFGYNTDKTPKRTDVVITETIEQLEEPDKNKIKVQNFKNQFQDLFQKITATVQQTKYSTGAYEKAVALAEANAEKKKSFLTDALSVATAKFQAAGQQSVTWGNDGVNVVDTASPCEAVKIIGGALAISHQNENGEQEWAAALTAKGISANLITAGILNVGELAIMNADEPLFKWDAHGISAFDTTVYEGDVVGTDTDKFVRFDKHGLYGVDGLEATWHPEDQDQIMETANFALTWDGLKVQGDEGATVRIGKTAEDLINITDTEGDSVFSVTKDGAVSMAGAITAGNGSTIGGWSIDTQEGIRNTDKTVGMVNPKTTLSKYTKQSLKGSGQTSKMSFYAGKAPSNSQTDIPEFAVLADGSMYATNAKIEGNIIANEGHIGGKNGWGIKTGGLWSGGIESAPEIYLGTEGIDATVGGNNKSNLLFKVSNDFGVTKEGDMYASSGSIANWDIAQSHLSKEVKVEELVIPVGERLVTKFSSWDNAYDETYYQGYLVSNYGFVAGKTYRLTAPEGTSLVLFKIANRSGDGATFGYNQFSFNEGDEISLTFTWPSGGYSYFYFFSYAGLLTGDALPMDIVISAVESIEVIERPGGTKHFYLGDPKDATDPLVQKELHESVVAQFGDCYITERGTVQANNIQAARDIGFVERESNDSILTRQIGWRDYGGGQVITSQIVVKGSSITVTGDISLDHDISFFYCIFDVTPDGNVLVRGPEILATDIGNGLTSFEVDIPPSGYVGIALSEEDPIPSNYPSSLTFQWIKGSAEKGFIFGGSLIPYFRKTENENVVTREVRECKLGTQVLPWSEIHGKIIYDDDGKISTSDLRKKSVVEFKPEYDNFFDSLNPITYQRVDGNHGRIHCGFGAQDVESALIRSGLTNMDFAGLCKWGEEGAEDYGLRYEEFVALNTRQIQQLKSRVYELESELALIRKEIADLKNK